MGDTTVGHDGTLPPASAASVALSTASRCALDRNPGSFLSASWSTVGSSAGGLVAAVLLADDVDAVLLLLLGALASWNRCARRSEKGLMFRSGSTCIVEPSVKAVSVCDICGSVTPLRNVVHLYGHDSVSGCRSSWLLGRSFTLKLADPLSACLRARAL